VTVDFSMDASGESAIELLDLTGRTVLARNVAVAEGANRVELGLEGLEPGVYFVRVDGRSAGSLTVAR
jgi:hypothetical protein